MVKRNRLTVGNALHPDSIEHLLSGLTTLKKFGKGSNLRISDFNILVAVNELSTSPAVPAPGRPYQAGTIKTIHLYTSEGREVIERRIKILIERGYILKMEPGRWSSANPNTYHISQAGREVINAYYEYAEEQQILKRKIYR